MRILVTGGAGFIGSHITDACLDAGHTVAVVDDLSTGKRCNANPAADFFEADIRQAKDLDAVFKRYRLEVVNHHAAQLSVSMSCKDPMQDASINIIGTLNVLESCVRHSVKKIIFASSGGTVYGRPNRFPVAEDAPLQGLSPYGIGKVAGEGYVRFFTETYGLDHTILRYSNVYGPRQNPAGEAGVIAIFCTSLAQGNIPIVFGLNKTGDAGCSRDYVYVADVARANVMALDRGHNQSLNIATGAETTTLQLCKKVCVAMGRVAAPNFGPPRLGDLSRNALDTSRAREALGWEPTTSLADGLTRTARHYRSTSATAA